MLLAIALNAFRVLSSEIVGSMFPKEESLPMLLKTISSASNLVKNPRGLPRGVYLANIFLSPVETFGVLEEWFL